MAKPSIIPKEENQPDAVVDSIRDLAVCVRILGNALKRLYPSPVTDEVLQVIERRGDAGGGRPGGGGEGGGRGGDGFQRRPVLLRRPSLPGRPTLERLRPLDGRERGKGRVRRGQRRRRRCLLRRAEHAALHGPERRGGIVDGAAGVGLVHPGDRVRSGEVRGGG